MSTPFSVQALLAGHDLIGNPGYQAIIEFLNRYVAQLDEAIMGSSKVDFVMNLVAEKRAAVKIINILKGGPDALETQLQATMTPQNIETARDMGLIPGEGFPSDNEIIN